MPGPRPTYYLESRRWTRSTKHTQNSASVEVLIELSKALRLLARLLRRQLDVHGRGSCPCTGWRRARGSSTSTSTSRCAARACAGSRAGRGAFASRPNAGEQPLPNRAEREAPHTKGVPTATARPAPGPSHHPDGSEEAHQPGGEHTGAEVGLCRWHPRRGEAGGRHRRRACLRRCRLRLRRRHRRRLGRGRGVRRPRRRARRMLS